MEAKESIMEPKEKIIPRWMVNGIKAHGTGPAKQGWKCYQCEKMCTVTTGLNEEPGGGDCHEADTHSMR